MKITQSALEKIVRGVREIVLPFYGKVEKVSFKNGHNHNIVTELDVKVEEYLKVELNKLDPRIGFVGEESGGDRSANKFWLVDPIDGRSCLSEVCLFVQRWWP